MMDFVPFEIAKKLKEIGFKEECLAFYGKSGDLCYNGFDASGYVDISDFYANYNLSGAYGAPTTSQVIKWLREEKKAYLSIRTHIVRDSKGRFSDVFSFSFYVFISIDKHTMYRHYNQKEYNTYEEVVLAGLEHVLDHL